VSLPQIATLEFNVETDIQTSSRATVHKTFDWDFELEDFKLKDGKLVEVFGLAYLKIWIRKALMTVKDTLIYEGKSFGSDHFTLIGTTFHTGYKQAEMERMIRECLLQNDAITSVDAFDFEQDGDLLTIRFNVISIYGATEVTI
jgi:hypothetical protein